MADTILKWDGDGSSNGPLTTANLAFGAGAGDTPPSVLQGSGHSIVSDALGSGILLTQATGAQSAAYWNFASRTSAFWRGYVTLGSPVTASSHILVRFGNVAVRGFDFVVATSGRFRLFRADNTVAAESPANVLAQPGTRYRVTVSAPTTGKVDVNVYAGESSTPYTTLSYDGAAGDLGTAFTRFVLGNASTTPTAEPARWDHINLDGTSVPPPLAIAPTVDLGADQTGIECGVPVTVTATTTGTVSSSTWAQVSGPAVVLSGTGLSRTFDSPVTLNGATVVLSCTATDAGSGLTGTDQISFTVLPATERVVMNGVEVPVVLARVTAP